MNQRGIALVSVLFALVAVLTLTSTLFFAVFVELQATSNASAGEEALYAADAGIEHLWSLLDPAEGFAREAAWAGGEPPFGPIVWFPEPPRTYRVRVSDVSASGLTAVSEGTSHRGSRRRVEAVFRREARFRPRAALILGAGGSMTAVTGTTDVRGSATDRDRSALGAETGAEATWLLRVTGSAWVPVIGSSGLAAAARRLETSATVTLAGSPAAGAWGDAGAPALVHILGPAELSGASSIAGILLVSGPLQVTGRVEIDGLLLAPDGLEISGELAVRGAAFVSSDLRILAPGRLTVLDSPAGLDLADTAANGSLPRAARLAAWRELW